jgi:hypothetical protein
MTALALRLTGAMLLAVAAACGGDAGGQADCSESSGNASAPADAARPPFELAQAPDDPCEWLSPEEVQAILGSFSAPPVRVRPGQNPTPDAYGTGCLYTLAIQPQLGTGTVTLSVALHGGEAADLVSAASASLFGVAPGTGDTSAAAGSGWDHQTRLGTTYLARIGHIGVQVDRGTFEIPDDKARQLAAAARDKMADRPFANRVDPFLDSLRKAKGSPAEPPPQGPDPCALLTRAEAEAVLGPLTVPPYRSAGDSPLWDANGESCSYFTVNGHRALTIRPTLSQGQMTFRMAAGMGAAAANVTGVDGGMAADTLEGPWDDVMQEMHGMLRFLKGGPDARNVMGVVEYRPGRCAAARGDCGWETVT